LEEILMRRKTVRRLALGAVPLALAAGFFTSHFTGRAMAGPTSPSDHHGHGRPHHHPPLSAATAGVRAGRGTLTVAGTSTTFVPRGFNTVGLLYPSEYADALCTQAGLSADEQKQLGAAADMLRDRTTEQVKAMKNHWNANSVRFQVSQGALALERRQAGTDPYTHAVLAAVKKARAAGMVVVVSLQTQRFGCTPLKDGKLVKLPDADSLNAWRQLTPTLRRDKGVMLEVFNEPQSKTACGLAAEWNWPQWTYGCDGKPEGGDGMLPLGRQVRKLAPHNVLLFDGENNAGKFNDFTPPAGIPANSAYAVHPYFFALGKSDWDARFGHLQESGKALVATEWNQSGSCDQPEDQAEVLVKDYLPAHRTGLFLHSCDAPYAALADPASNYAPVDSVPTCTQHTGATLVHDYFIAQQDSPATGKLSKPVATRRPSTAGSPTPTPNVTRPKPNYARPATSRTSPYPRTTSKT
jgi:hypothetical protein